MSYGQVQSLCIYPEPIQSWQMFVICVDSPLTDGDGSQTLSNGEEKLAERMVKDSEPRKSIGGFSKNEING